MPNQAQKIKKAIKNDILFFDGAFGTYFSLLYNEENCELANINAPNKTEKIHREYAQAGANLLRTNTYSANCFNEAMNLDISEQVIRSGYKIASEVASDFKNCMICADIGPIYNNVYDDENNDDIDILDEYKRIIDIFLDEGAKVFVFETMSDIAPLDKAVDYLRSKAKDAYIICQFAFRPDGFTKSAIGIETMIEAFNNVPCDAIGFNCASGPAHILTHARKAFKTTKKPMSALPNASFPALYEGRQIYNEAEGYFVEIMLETIALGVKFVGGCCGTTPAHIYALVEACKNNVIKSTAELDYKETQTQTYDTAVTNIDMFVELSPPTTSKLPNLLKKCQKVEQLGVKNITLPDSPLARTRMNPLIISSAIRDKTSLDTLVHLCCRDRNIIAMQSDLLAGWALGLRNLLCVTGDPVAAGGRDDIKSVFNISSTNLMKLVSHMNKEIFKEAPINIYGAVNLTANNFESVIKRSKNKVDAGAIGFLSQPIFSPSDIGKVKEFKQKVNAKLYVGIMPPVTYKNALFLKNEVPDINIPDNIIEGFSKISDPTQAEEYGCNVVSKLAIESLKYADGLYIMPPFGRVSCVYRIIDYINKNSCEECYG